MSLKIRQTSSPFLNSESAADQNRRRSSPSSGAKSLVGERNGHAAYRNGFKVVFLDRDGVINQFPGEGNYVTKVKEFHFIPRSLEALRRLTQNGFTVFVVSNQAGVGKGIYSQHKLNQINNYMIRHVLGVKAKIKKAFYCTHRSDAGCDCRKPKIGSIKRALKILNKPLHFAKKAFFVGDTRADIAAGYNAGCTTIFVLSGGESRAHIKEWQVKPDYIVKDLWEATNIIEHENSHRSRLRRSRAH